MGNQITKINQLENDVVQYIMGLWHQKRIQTYIKLKGQK